MIADLGDPYLASSGIWLPVYVLAALLPVLLLPACDLRKQWRMTQDFGTLHVHERPGLAHLQPFGE